MVEGLKARFQGYTNVTCEPFDLRVDPGIQGFDEKDFDFIIAAGALSKMLKLSESLARIRQLLSPSGRLLIQSLRPGLLWSRYVLGLFSNWEIGVNEGRADLPHVNVESWQERLTAADLEVVSQLVSDAARLIHYQSPQRTFVE